MKEPDSSSGPANRATDFPDAHWVKEYPTICEYLVCEEYEGGKSRDPSTLTVKAQDGRVLLVINDHDRKRSGFCMGDDVVKALRALEKALAGPGPDWRSWGGKGKRR